MSLGNKAVKKRLDPEVSSGIQVDHRSINSVRRQIVDKKTLTACCMMVWSLGVCVCACVCVLGLLARLVLHLPLCAFQCMQNIRIGNQIKIPAGSVPLYLVHVVLQS